MRVKITRDELCVLKKIGNFGWTPTEMRDERSRKEAHVRFVGDDRPVRRPKPERVLAFGREKQGKAHLATNRKRPRRNVLTMNDLFSPHKLLSIAINWSTTGSREAVGAKDDTPFYMHAAGCFCVRTRNKKGTACENYSY